MSLLLLFLPQATQTITPAAVTLPLVVPTPAVALGAITISPDPVAVPLIIPTPAVTTPLGLAPDPVAVPLVVPAPTITVPATQTVTPEPVAIALVVPQPTVTSAITPVPPVVVTGGGGFPTRGQVHPFPSLIPEPLPPRQVLRPEPVVIVVSVMLASVSIDWLSKLRYEDEELLLAGIL